MPVYLISTEFGYAEFSGNAYLFLESCNRLLCAAYCCTCVGPIRPVLTGVCAANCLTFIYNHRYYFFAVRLCVINRNKRSTKLVAVLRPDGQFSAVSSLYERSKRFPLHHLVYAFKIRKYVVASDIYLMCNIPPGPC